MSFLSVLAPPREPHVFGIDGRAMPETTLVPYDPIEFHSTKPVVVESEIQPTITAHTIAVTRALSCVAVPKYLFPTVNSARLKAQAINERAIALAVSPTPPGRHCAEREHVLRALQPKASRDVDEDVPTGVFVMPEANEEVRGQDGVALAKKADKVIEELEELGEQARISHIEMRQSACESTPEYTLAEWRLVRRSLRELATKGDNYAADALLCLPGVVELLPNRVAGAAKRSLIKLSLLGILLRVKY